jgi:DNA-binding NarL/FixJ family response regulator
MPRMSGLQATTEIKRKGLASRVVILSVHSDPQDMSLSIQAGADYFIQKGSSYAELIQAIKPTNP